MKFITFFTGALVATTATNILLSSDAYAVSLPNGWKQVGQSCRRPGTKTVWPGTEELFDIYYKLVKSGTTQYGVYNGSTGNWVSSYGASTKTSTTKGSGTNKTTGAPLSDLLYTETTEAFTNKSFNKEEANAKMNSSRGTKSYQPAAVTTTKTFTEIN